MSKLRSPIKKAVIPVAGYGTRFLPFTKSVPKEMLPLVDRPVIELIVEEAVQSGITQIILITGSNKRAIEDYFDYNLELEAELKKAGKDQEVKLIRSISDRAQFIYIRQKEPLGLGHAVWQAQATIGEEPFAVLYGDDVIVAPQPVLKQMIRVHERYPGVVLGVTEVPETDIGRYGVVQGELVDDRLYKVQKFIEKPTPSETSSRLVISGRVILPAAIFPILAATPPGKGGEIQLTDAIATLIERSHGFAYHYLGEWYDCGNKLGYLKAVTSFAMRHPTVGEEFRVWLNRVRS